jgi:phospholipase/carboxylesterase
MSWNFWSRVKKRPLGRRQFLLSSFAATLSTTLLLSANAQTNPSSENQSNSLKFISVQPTNGGMPRGVIVCLHGSGAKSQSLASLAGKVNLPDYLFLFPDAPFPDPSVSGGKLWYDLKSPNHKGLAESRQRLTHWLKWLPSITGIPLESTILSGFSQGAAMTLDVGLTLPLAGLVSLSGYLPSSPKLPVKRAWPPVLMVQGTQDKIVTLDEAHSARDKLEALGVKVRYKELDMGHELNPQELELMRDFVMDII